MNTSNSLNAGLISSQGGLFTNAPRFPVLSIPLDYDSSLILHYPFNGDLLDYTTGVGVSNTTPTNGNVKLSYDYSVNSNTSLNNSNSGVETSLGLNRTNYPTNTLGYTISFWIYEASSTTGGGFFYFGSDAVGTKRMYAYLNPAFRINYTNGADYISSSIISMNTWYHVVMVINPTNCKIYLNGVLNVNATTSNYFPTNIMDNGAYLLSSPSSSPFNAYMYDFRLYNRSLSATEIMELYNIRIFYNSLATPLDVDSSLILRYPFNGDIYNYNQISQNASGQYILTGISDASVQNASYTTLTTINYAVGSGSLRNYTNGGLITTNLNLNYTIPANTNGYTFSFWFNLDSTSSGVFFQFSNGTNYVYMSYTGTNVNIGTNSSFLSTGFNPSLNTWYHVVWTNNSSPQNILYVNGVSYYTSSTNLYISYSFNTNKLCAGGNAISCYMNDFRYYNRVLNSGEIQQLYNLNVSPFSLNYDPYLCIYYAFDSYQSNNTINLYNYAVSPYGTTDASFNGGSVDTANYVVGTGSLNLSSGSNYIIFGSNNILNTTGFVGSNGLTFAYWFKADAAANAYIFYFTVTGGNDKIYILIASSNTITFGTSNGGGTANTNNVTTSFSSSVWKHVIWTITPTTGSNCTWNIYINGTLANTFTSIPYPSSVARNNSTIGINGGTFVGRIDDFRIYQRVLNSTEAYALYTYRGSFSANASTIVMNPPTTYRGKLSYNYYYSSNSINYNWATAVTGGYNSFSITSDGTSLYVVNLTNQTITKYNVSNGSLVDTFTGYSTPRFITYYSSNLYLGYSSGLNYFIAQISPTNGSIINSTWYSSGTNKINGLAASNGYIYACSDAGVGTVIKILISNPATFTIPFSGLTYAYNIRIDSTGTYGYVNCLNKIVLVNISTNTIINSNWITINNPSVFEPYGSYLFASNINTTIQQYNLSTGSLINSTWASGFTELASSVIVNDTIYALDWGTTNKIVKIPILPIHPFLSSITNISKPYVIIPVVDVYQTSAITYLINSQVSSKQSAYVNRGANYFTYVNAPSLISAVPYSVPITNSGFASTAVTTDTYATSGNASTLIPGWTLSYNYSGSGSGGFLIGNTAATSNYDPLSNSITRQFIASETTSSVQNIYFYKTQNFTSDSSYTLSFYTAGAGNGYSAATTLSVSISGNTVTPKIDLVSNYVVSTSNWAYLTYGFGISTTGNYDIVFRTINTASATNAISITDISLVKINNAYLTWTTSTNGTVSTYLESSNNAVSFFDLASSNTNSATVIPYTYTQPILYVQAKLTNNLYSCISNPVTFLNYYVTSPTGLTATQNVTIPLTNGNFATPSASLSPYYVVIYSGTSPVTPLPGWTFGSLTTTTFVRVATANYGAVPESNTNLPNGAQFISITTQPTDSPFFYQNVTLSANNVYLISFYIAHTKTANSLYSANTYFRLDISGTSTTQNLVTNFIPPKANWVFLSYPFTVSSNGSYALKFTITNNNTGSVIASIIDIASVSLVAMDAARLTWTAPSTNGNLLSYSYSYDNGITQTLTNSTSLSYEILDTFNFGPNPYYFIVSTDLSENVVNNPISNEASCNIFFSGNVTNFVATQSSTDANYQTANLSWTAPATTYGTLGGYTITYFDNSSGNISLNTTSTASTSITISSLNKGDTYYFLIYPTITQIANNPTISYEQSVIMYYTNAPVSLTVSSQTSLTSVTLSWTPPALYLGTINYYYYGYSTNNGGTSVTYSNVSAPTTTGTINGLTASSSGGGNSIYYFYVRNSISQVTGVSGPYTLSSQYTMYYIDAPTGLLLIQKSITDVSFSWTASSNNGGTIQYYYNNGVTSNNTSNVYALFNGLTVGGTYTFSVYARNDAITEYQTTTSNITGYKLASINTPTGLYLNQTTNANVTFGWTDSPYDLGDSTFTSREYVYEYTGSTGSPVLTTGANNVAITGLTSGGTYNFAVSSKLNMVNVFNFTQSILSYSAAPIISYQLSVINTPSSLYLIQTTNGNVTFGWTNNGYTLGTVGATPNPSVAYNYAYTGSSLLGPITNTSVLISGLTTGNSYFFSVYAQLNMTNVFGNTQSITSTSVGTISYQLSVINTPTNPTVVHAVDASGISYINAVVFSWTNNGYTLGTVGATPNPSVAYNYAYTGSSLLGPITNTSVLISGLTTGGSYTFYVYALLNMTNYYNINQSVESTKANVSFTLGNITGASETGSYTNTNFNPSRTYTIYYFKTGSSFTCVNQNLSGGTVIVGGGGPGGGAASLNNPANGVYSGGGGGGGDVGVGTLYYESGYTYSYTIAGSTTGLGPQATAVNGANTLITGGTLTNYINETAYGGGYGGTNNNYNNGNNNALNGGQRANGGSAGGGAFGLYNGNPVTGSGTGANNTGTRGTSAGINNGKIYYTNNNGGNAGLVTSQGGAGGGGGAQLSGKNGSLGSNNSAGAGGNGVLLQDIYNVYNNVKYGAGGGGGSYNTVNTSYYFGAGGNSGGGAGGDGTGASATENTGSGGGGGGTFTKNNNTAKPGGDGASGVIFIAFRSG